MFVVDPKKAAYDEIEIDQESYKPKLEEIDANNDANTDYSQGRINRLE